jgi:hypothetical protein
MKTAQPCNCECRCGYLVIPGEFAASLEGRCAACLGGLHREDDSPETSVLSEPPASSEKKRPRPRRY